MDKETYTGLSIARINRAAELLQEAEELIASGRYKSANNRAFYCIEKMHEGPACAYADQCGFA